MDKTTPLLAKLPVPNNLFDGYNYPSADLPYKVNVFKRRNIKELLEETIHLHYRFNLVLNLKGEVTINLDGKFIHFYEKNCLIIHPYQNHYYVPQKDEDIEWLYIGFELPQKERLKQTKYKLFPFGLEVESIIYYILSSNTLNRPYKAEITCLLTDLLLYYCLSETSYNHSQSIEIKTHSPKMRVVSDIQTWIYKNLDKNINIKHLSNSLHISESHLRAVFRETMGISLGSYIRKTKINRACKIMESTTSSMTEIAFQCGFDSLYSFSRAFKAIMGMPPKDYKQSLTH